MVTEKAIEITEMTCIPNWHVHIWHIWDSWLFGAYLGLQVEFSGGLHPELAHVDAHVDGKKTTQFLSMLDIEIILSLNYQSICQTKAWYDGFLPFLDIYGMMGPGMMILSISISSFACALKVLPGHIQTLQDEPARPAVPWSVAAKTRPP